MGEAPDKEELGGARAQTRAGAVDNEAADEDDALEQIRRFLSYLPAERLGGAAGRGVRRPGRAARGRAAVAWSRATAASPYAMRSILDAVLDRGSRVRAGRPATGAR